jgi:hypothetical protein
LRQEHCLPFGNADATKYAMERYLFSSAGILLLGTLGAFLLFVPIMSIVTVTLVLIGLALMFCLGIQVGRRKLPRVKDGMPRVIQFDRNSSAPEGFSTHLRS